MQWVLIHYTTCRKKYVSNFIQESIVRCPSLETEAGSTTLITNVWRTDLNMNTLCCYWMYVSAAVYRINNDNNASLLYHQPTCWCRCRSVSYTHLDVYKRQPPYSSRNPGYYGPWLSLWYLQLDSTQASVKPKFALSFDCWRLRVSPEFGKIICRWYSLPLILTQMCFILLCRPILYYYRPNRSNTSTLNKTFH